MEKIEKTFCKALYKWQETHFKGSRTELGKLFNVSQGYISNVLAGRRCGDETWRRFVAKKIGYDYDTMIGVAKDNPENIIQFETIEDEEHFRVTKKFKHKPLAIEINQGLLEIESYGKEELEEIKENINSRLGKLRKKNKDDSKNAALGEANSKLGS